MAKRKGGNVTAIVEQLARPVVEQLGYRLWDVRYEKEGPDWFLRVFIDMDGDMNTSDCEVVSRALDPLIDEADPLEESYYFEVSSPGLGRRLVKPEHFDACKGEKCMVRLFRPDEDGVKEHTGILLGMAEGMVAVDCDGTEKRFELSKITLAKLCDDEDLFSAGE